MRHMCDLNLSEHLSAAGCHGCLKHDHVVFRLTGAELSDDRSLESAVDRIFDGPALEAMLRVLRLLCVVGERLEGEIFRVEGSKELACRLIEPLFLVWDDDGEGLLLCRFVREGELVAQCLSRDELAKGDNFLIDLKQLTNVQLLTFTRLSRLEQIRGLQPLFLQEDILDRFGSEICVRNEITHVLRWALESAHLLFERTRLLRALQLQFCLVFGIRELAEGLRGRLRVLLISQAVLLADGIDAFKRRVLLERRLSCFLQLNLSVALALENSEALLIHLLQE